MSTLLNSNTYVRIQNGVLSYSVDNEATWNQLDTGVVSTWAMPNAPNTPALELFWQVASGDYKYVNSDDYATIALSTQAIYANAENGGVEVVPTGILATLTPSTPPVYDMIPVLSNYDMMGNTATNARPSVANGEMVVHEQLVTVQQAIADAVTTLTAQLAPKITGPQATTIAQQIVDAAVAGLQNAQQVQQAIALAIAGLDEVLSIPVKRVFSGALSSVVTTDLIAGDGNLEGLAQSGVLVISPTAGETGVYYLNQSGNLTSYTQGLIEQGLEVGTWIWAEDAEGNTLAHRVIDITPFQVRAVAAPAAYTDEIDNGVVVDAVTRKIFLQIDPSQFAFDGQRRLVLASAIKAAIDMVPLLDAKIDNHAALITTLQQQVAAQGLALPALTGRVTAVEAENAVQAQTLLTQAQTLSTQANRLTTAESDIDALELGKVDKTALRPYLDFRIVNGVPQNLDGSAFGGAVLGAGSTLAKGFYDVTHNLGVMVRVQVAIETGAGLLECERCTTAKSPTVQMVAVPKSGTFRVRMSGGTAGVFLTSSTPGHPPQGSGSGANNGTPSVGVSSSRGFVFRLMPNGDLQQSLNGDWVTRDTGVIAARFRQDGGGYDRLTYVGSWAQVPSSSDPTRYHNPRHLVSTDNFTTIQTGSSNDWYVDAFGGSSIDIPVVHL